MTRKAPAKMAPDNEPQIETLFQLHSVTLKDRRWHIKITLFGGLDKIFQTYTMRFFLYRRPFEGRVREAENALDRARNADKDLFGDEFDRHVKDAEDDVAAAKESLAEAEKKYVDIEFPVVIEKAENNVPRTVLHCLITPEDVALLDQFKSELMPENPKDDPTYQVSITHE